MYSISICFGPAATVWNLLFKTEESANAAYAELPKGDVTDDFGQKVCIAFTSIHGLLLEALDASQLGQVERGVHNARSQAKAQERAMSDPVISQSLRRQQQGPAVMAPVPGGRFNG